MRFINDNNDPDFWSRDHYADDPTHPLHNFDPEAERHDAEQPEEQIDTGTRFGCIPKSQFNCKAHLPNHHLYFHQVKSPRLNIVQEPEDIFPQNSLILLAGQPKIGKTIISLALAKAIATGKPFAGQKITRQPVGYISFDDSPHELKHALAKHNDLTSETPLFIATDLDPIDTKSGQMQIEDFLLHHSDATVIIDSFHAAIDKSRTNDARAMRKLLTPIKRISERAGRIIIIHHTNAYGTRIADHTQLQAAVSQTILMTYEQREEHRIIKWESKGRGQGTTRTFHLASPDDTTFKLISLNPFENLDPRDKSTIPILNALATGPKSMTQIAMETKLTFKRVEKRIAKILADGHIRKQPSSPHSMRQPQKYMTI